MSDEAQTSGDLEQQLRDDTTNQALSAGVGRFLPKPSTSPGLLQAAALADRAAR